MFLKLTSIFGDPVLIPLHCITSVWEHGEVTQVFLDEGGTSQFYKVKETADQILAMTEEL